MKSDIILRYTIVAILLMHGVTSLANGNVNGFGHFLNQKGFAPAGVLLAWVIKLSHVVCAVLLVVNKYVRAACIVTIFILVMGIIFVHGQHGWFVVGGGTNGVEFNLLLIAGLAHFLISGKN